MYNNILTTLPISRMLVTHTNNTNKLTLMMVHNPLLRLPTSIPELLTPRRNKSTINNPLAQLLPHSTILTLPQQLHPKLPTSCNNKPSTANHPIFCPNSPSSTTPTTPIIHRNPSNT